MRRSFSVEDLLDEVEKICYNASETSKVSNKLIPLNLQGFCKHRTTLHALCNLLCINTFVD